MARDQKIFIEVDTEKVRDEDGNVYSNTEKPYISAKEKVNLIQQYCTQFVSIDDFTAYGKWVGKTLSGSAVIDNDWNHVDKGFLVNSELSGVITSVTISGLSNTPQTTGTIQLINGSSESDLIAYTNPVTSGDNYIFTIDSYDLDTHSYVAGDNANTNDPALIKSLDIDFSEKDTGIITTSLDADSLPYLLEVEGISEISSCIYELQLFDSEGSLAFVAKSSFSCLNTLDDNGALPPPSDSSNFYTKVQSLALFVPRDFSSMDIGSTLTLTDRLVVDQGAGAVTVEVQDVVDLIEDGNGDMLSSIYDPNAVEGDAFDMDNMTEGTTNKILTVAERTKVSAIEIDGSGETLYLDDAGNYTAPPSSSGGATISTELSDMPTTAEYTSATLGDKLVKSSTGYELIPSTTSGGFDDVDAQTISYDYTLNRLTITPTDASYSFVTNNGVRYTKTSDYIDIIVNDGLMYVYYDNTGTLVQENSPDRNNQVELMLSTLPISYMVYNDSTGVVTCVCDYMKGRVNSQMWVKNLYDKAIYNLNGIVPFGITEGDGDLNADAQFGLSAGNALFVDRKFEVPLKASTSTWIVAYFSPEFDIITVEDNALPLLSDINLSIGTTGRLAFNNFGTPTVATSTNYCYYFVAVTNSIDSSERLISIMGNKQYTNTDSAEAGLSGEIAYIESAMLIKQGMTIIDAVLCQTNTSYANDVKTKIISVTAVSTAGSSYSSIGSTPDDLVNGGDASSLHEHDSLYINKTNTDTYTPTADYHPATKKYVDDNAGGGYTPSSTTNAVVDTSSLTADTVTNTYATTTDGTVIVPDSTTNGAKYWLYVSSDATVTITNVTGDVLFYVYNIDKEFCIEYSTVSSSYKNVR